MLVDGRELTSQSTRVLRYFNGTTTLEEMQYRTHLDKREIRHVMAVFKEHVSGREGRGAHSTINSTLMGAHFLVISAYYIPTPVIRIIIIIFIIITVIITTSAEGPCGPHPHSKP